MKEPKWLLSKAVVSIHQMLLAEHGGGRGVRDKGLLDSALDRPINKYQYDESVNLYDLAAAYSFGLARNHPFVDGNKRTALVAGLVFLEINGIEAKAPEPETVLMFNALASGELREEELSRWYEFHSSA